MATLWSRQRSRSLEDDLFDSSQHNWHITLGRLFVGMILILIFAEALGLYGLIVGLVVASASDKPGLCTPYA